MISKNQIADSLQQLVEDLVKKSPFFKTWNKESVGLSESRKFLMTFDSLVKSFPSLIAAGAARMEDEATRVTLAVNLYQESGEGDLSRTHHAIYRKFLATAGIDPSLEPESDFASQWRSNLAGFIQTVENPLAALGALAAGEFLAQPALGRIYPVLKSHYPQADQEYFTKHLVLETEHVEEITDVIAKVVKNDRDWKNLLEGFKKGLQVWETYFSELSRFIA